MKCFSLKDIKDFLDMMFECPIRYNHNDDIFICIPEDDPPFNITRTELVSMLKKWFNTKDITLSY